MGVDGQCHAPSALPLDKQTRYSSYMMSGGPQGQSGQVWKFSPPPGFDAWSAYPVISHYTNYGILAHAYPHIYVYMDLSCFTTVTSVLS
jgi:hypothetical protein